MLLSAGNGWLRKLLTAAGSGLIQWGLASGQSICLQCGKGYKERSELGICRSCAGSIPWIIDVVCERCGRYEACNDCSRREDTFFIRNRSAVAYSETMKGWLAIYKYRGDEKLRKLLGRMLLHAYRLHTQAKQWRENDALTVISYVPLSEERREERGFNQSEQLAEELARQLRLPVFPILRRVRHTGKQSYKTRQDRLEDMKDAFAVHPEYLRNLSAAVNGRDLRIMLVDDVYTTGSTLNQCAKTIRAAIEASVYGLSWSR